MMKICTKCKIKKPLTEFYNSKRSKDGVSSWCIVCDKERKANYEDKRKRWLTKEGKEYHKKYHRKHYRENREKYLLRGYKKQDKQKGLTCNLTTQWMLDNITSSPCTYCGSLERIGCDRVDNNLGHLKGNVIPCCAVCNSVRNNNFSVAEMMKLGKTIKQIYKERS